MAVAAGRKLLIWNAQTKTQEDTVTMPADKVATDGDGLLWVAYESKLSACRWQGKFAEVGSWQCTRGGVRELITGRDGVVYGLTSDALIAVPRGGGPPRVISDCPSGATHLAAGPAGRLYFAEGDVLYELQVTGQ